MHLSRSLKGLSVTECDVHLLLNQSYVYTESIPSASPLGTMLNRSDFQGSQLRDPFKVMIKGKVIEFDTFDERGS